MSEPVINRFHDRVVSCASCDVTGRLLATVSAKGVEVVSVSELSDPLPLVIVSAVASPRGEPAMSAEWCPHASASSVLATTSPGATVAIWNVAMPSSSSLVARIQTAQSPSARADFSWSPFDPNLIITCGGQGSLVKLFDVRDARTPKAISAKPYHASLVAWNRVNRWHFATAHDTGEVRFWDIRAERDTNFITAHRTRVTFIEWSPADAAFLLSTGQEKNVKVWNVNEPRDCATMLALPTHVAKARFTPSGFGIAVSAQNDPAISLWHLRSLSDPVHTFKGGHSGPATAFDWRRTADGGRAGLVSAAEFELVSFGRDKSVAQWPIPESVAQAVDAPFDLGGLVATRTDSRSKDSSSSSQADLLEREFDAAARPKPGSSVAVSDIDRGNRSCIATCTGKAHGQQLSVRVKMSFPSLYPREAAPSFELLQSFSNNTQQNIRIIKSLSKKSQQLVEKNKPCLEAVISELDAVFAAEIASISEAAPTQGQEQGGQADPSISQPCPRLSGCCFSPNGRIMFFVEKRANRLASCPRTYAQFLSQQQQPQATPQSKFASPAPAATPRAQQAMPAIPTHYTVSSSLYSKSEIAASPMHIVLPDFLHVVRPIPVQKRPEERATISSLLLAGVHSFLPFSPNLARAYSLEGTDARAVAEHNEKAATDNRRRDLASLWHLIGILVDPAAIEAGHGTDLGARQRGVPWTLSPMGKPLVAQIFDHYEKVKDIQTLGMVACVLSMFDGKLQRRRPLSTIVDDPLRVDQPPRPSSTSPSFTPILAPSPQPGMRDIAVPPPLTLSQSKSAQARHTVHTQLHLTIPKIAQPTATLLDPTLRVTYNRYRIAYASLLHRWRMFQEMVCVLNFIDPLPHAFCTLRSGCPICSPDGPVEKEFQDKICWSCNRSTSEPWCKDCRRLLGHCSLCELSVRGISWFCPLCLHGGHLSHMMEWFQSNECCAAGCGCQCRAQKRAEGAITPRMPTVPLRRLSHSTRPIPIVADQQPH